MFSPSPRKQQTKSQVELLASYGVTSPFQNIQGDNNNNNVNDNNSQISQILKSPESRIQNDDDLYENPLDYSSATTPGQDNNSNSQNQNTNINTDALGASFVFDMDKSVNVSSLASTAKPSNVTLSSQKGQQQHHEASMNMSAAAATEVSTTTSSGSVLAMILEDAEQSLFSHLEQSKDILTSQNHAAVKAVQTAKERQIELANVMSSTSTHGHHAKSGGHNVAHLNRGGGSRTNSPHHKNASSSEHRDSDSKLDSSQNNNSRKTHSPQHHGSNTSPSNNSLIAQMTANSKYSVQASRSFDASEIIMTRRTALVSSHAYHMQQRLNHWKFSMPTNCQEDHRREKEIMRALQDFDFLARRVVQETLKYKMKHGSWPFFSGTVTTKRGSTTASSSTNGGGGLEIIHSSTSWTHLVGMMDSSSQKNNNDNFSAASANNSHSSTPAFPPWADSLHPHSPSQCKPLLAEATFTVDGVRCVMLCQPRLLEMWGSLSEAVRAAKDEVKHRAFLLHNCLSCRRVLQVPMCSVVTCFGFPVFCEVDIGLSGKASIIGGGVFSETVVPINTISKDPNSNESIIFAEMLKQNNQEVTQAVVDSFTTRGMTADEQRTCTMSSFVFRVISNEFGLAAHRILKDPILFLNNDCEIHSNPFDHYLYIRNVRRLFPPVVSSAFFDEEDKKRDDEQKAKQAAADAAAAAKETTPSFQSYSHSHAHHHHHHKQERPEEPKIRFRPEFWWATLRRHPTQFLSSDAFRAVSNSASAASTQAQLAAGSIHDKLVTVASNQLYASCIKNLVGFFIKEVKRLDPSVVFSPSSSGSFDNNTNNNNASNKTSNQQRQNQQRATSFVSTGDNNGSSSSSELGKGGFDDIYADPKTTTSIHWQTIPLSFVPRVFHAFGVNFSLAGQVLKLIEKEIGSTASRNSCVIRSIRLEMASRAATEVLSCIFREIAITNAGSSSNTSNNNNNNNISSPTSPNNDASSFFSPTSSSAFNEKVIQAKLEKAATHFLQNMMSDTLSEVSRDDKKLWEEHVIPTVLQLFCSSASSSTRIIGASQDNHKQQQHLDLKSAENTPQNISDIDMYRKDIIPELRDDYVADDDDVSLLNQVGLSPTSRKLLGKEETTTTTATPEKQDDSVESSGENNNKEEEKKSTTATAAAATTQKQKEQKTSSFLQNNPYSPSQFQPPPASSTPSSMNAQVAIFQSTKPKERSTIVRTTGATAVKRIDHTNITNINTTEQQQQHHNKNFYESNTVSIAGAMDIVGAPISVTSRVDVKPWGQTKLNSDSSLNHQSTASAVSPIPFVASSPSLVRSNSSHMTPNAKRNKIQNNEDFGGDDGRSTSSLVSSKLRSSVASATTKNSPASSSSSSTTTKHRSIIEQQQKQQQLLSLAQKRFHQRQKLLAAKLPNFVISEIPPMMKASTSSQTTHSGSSSKVSSHIHQTQSQILNLPDIKFLDPTISSSSSSSSSSSQQQQQQNTNKNQKQQQQQQQQKQKSWRDDRLDYLFLTSASVSCSKSAKQLPNAPKYFVDSTQDWRFAERLLQLSGISLRDPHPIEARIDALGRYCCEVEPVTCASLLMQEPIMDRISYPRESIDVLPILRQIRYNMETLRGIIDPSIAAARNVMKKSDRFLLKSGSAGSGTNGGNDIDIDDENHLENLDLTPPSNSTFEHVHSSSPSNTNNSGNENNSNENNSQQQQQQHHHHHHHHHQQHHTATDPCLLDFWFRCIELARYLGDSSRYRDVVRSAIEMLQHEFAGATSDLGAVPLLMSLSRVDADSSAMASSIDHASIAVLKAEQSLPGTVFLIQAWENIMECARATESVSSVGANAVSADVVGRLRYDTAEKLRLAAKSIADKATGAMLGATEALEQLATVFEWQSDKLVRSAMLQSLTSCESHRHEVFAAISTVCNLSPEELCPPLYNVDIPRMKDAWRDACKAAISLALQEGALPSRKSSLVFSQLLFKITTFVSLIRYKLIFQQQNKNNNNDNTDNEQQQHYENEQEHEDELEDQEQEKRDRLLFGNQIDSLRNTVQLLKRHSAWISKFTRTLTHASSLQSPDIASPLVSMAQALLGLHVDVRCDIETLDGLYRRAGFVERRHLEANLSALLPPSSCSGLSALASAANQRAKQEQQGFFSSGSGADTESISHQSKSDTYRTGGGGGGGSELRSQQTGFTGLSSSVGDDTSSVGTEDFGWIPPSPAETLRARGFSWLVGSVSTIAFLNAQQAQAQAQASSSGGVGRLSSAASVMNNLVDPMLVSVHEDYQHTLDRDTIYFFRQWSTRLFKDVPAHQSSQLFLWDAALQRPLSDLISSCHRFSLFPEIAIRISKEILSTAIANCSNASDEVWQLSKHRAHERQRMIADRCKSNSKALNIKLMQHPLRLLRLGLESAPIPVSVLPVLLDVGASLLLCSLSPPWREERDKAKMQQHRAFHGRRHLLRNLGRTFAGAMRMGGGAGTHSSSISHGSGSISKKQGATMQHLRATQNALNDQQFLQSAIPTKTVWFPHSVSVRLRPAFFLTNGEYVVNYATSLNMKEPLVGVAASNPINTFSGAAFSGGGNISESGKDPYAQLLPKTIDIALSGVDRLLMFVEETVFLLHHTAMNYPVDRRTVMSAAELQKWFSIRFLKEGTGFDVSNSSNHNVLDHIIGSQDSKHSTSMKTPTSSSLNNPAAGTGSSSASTTSSSQQQPSSQQQHQHQKSQQSNKDNEKDTENTTKEKEIPPEFNHSSTTQQSLLSKWFMTGTWAQSSSERDHLLKCMTELVRSNQPAATSSVAAAARAAAEKEAASRGGGSFASFSRAAGAGSPNSPSSSSPFSSSLNNNENDSQTNKNTSNTNNLKDGGDEEDKANLPGTAPRLELATHAGRVVSLVLHNVLLPIMAEARLLDETGAGLQKDARRATWCEILNHLLRIVTICETVAASIPFEESVMFHVSSARRDFNIISGRPLYLHGVVVSNKEQHGASSSSTNNIWSKVASNPKSVPRWDNLLHESEKKRKSHLATLIEIERVFFPPTSSSSSENNNNNSAYENSVFASSLQLDQSSSMYSLAASIQIDKQQQNNNNSHFSSKISKSFKEGGRIPRLEECSFRLFVMTIASQVGLFELGAIPTGQAAFETKAQQVAQHLETRLKEETELVQAITGEKKQILSSLPKKQQESTSTVASRLKIAKQKAAARSKEKESESVHGMMTVSPGVVTLPFVPAAGAANDDDANLTRHSSSSSSPSVSVIAKKQPPPTIQVAWTLPKLATPNRPTVAVLPAPPASDSDLASSAQNINDNNNCNHECLQLKNALEKITTFEVRTVKGQCIITLKPPAIKPGLYVVGYFTESRPDHTPCISSEPFTVVMAHPPRK